MSDDGEDTRAMDAARVRFDLWREVFLSALEGTASSDQLIVVIVDKAADIADEAVSRIGDRVPK